MVYKRFVEIGRVALINEGPDSGKLAVIVDVIDQKRALVTGPCSGVLRQGIAFNKLWLTDFTLRISPSARNGQVQKAYEKADIGTKWEQTAWARRLRQKAVRAKLSDFDRFKIKCLKQQKSRVVKGCYNKLRREAANK